MLNVLIIGYGELASALTLGVIESGHNLVGVYRWTKKERSSSLLNIEDYFNPDIFYSLIKKYKISEINAPSVNSESFRKQALKLQPDVILVGSWGEKFERRVILLPGLATVNCHPSLLPKYRGSNPYFSTIKNGEKVSGITFHLMNDRYDAGEILLQKQVDIAPNDTGGSLRSKCAYIARKTVSELLEGLSSGVIMPLEQNEEKSTYHLGIKSKDIMIEWDATAEEIHNKIRAIRPWAYCYTKHNNQILRIEKSVVRSLKHSFCPGFILEKSRDTLSVATSDKSKVLDLSGIRVFAPLSQFWSHIYFNHRIKPGDILEAYAEYKS